MLVGPVFLNENGGLDIFKSSELLNGYIEVIDLPRYEFFDSDGNVLQIKCEDLRGRNFSVQRSEIFKKEEFRELLLDYLFEKTGIQGGNLKLSDLVDKVLSIKT